MYRHQLLFRLHPDRGKRETKSRLLTYSNEWVSPSPLPLHLLLPPILISFSLLQKFFLTSIVIELSHGNKLLTLHNRNGTLLLCTSLRYQGNHRFASLLIEDFYFFKSKPFSSISSPSPFQWKEGYFSLFKWIIPTVIV